MEFKIPDPAMLVGPQGTETCLRELQHLFGLVGRNYKPQTLQAARTNNVSTHGPEEKDSILQSPRCKAGFIGKVRATRKV